jgi:hypothetical protein
VHGRVDLGGRRIIKKKTQPIDHDKPARFRPLQQGRHKRLIDDIGHNRIEGCSCELEGEGRLTRHPE